MDFHRDDFSAVICTQGGKFIAVSSKPHVFVRYNGDLLMIKFKFDHARVSLLAMNDDAIQFRLFHMNKPVGEYLQRLDMGLVARTDLRITLGIEGFGISEAQTA